MVAAASIPDPALSGWEDEGGAIAVSASIVRRSFRAPQDTSDGCTAMAAADLARAALEPAGWARTRYEHSAVAWSRRAKLLEGAEKRAAVKRGA